MATSDSGLRDDVDVALNRAPRFAGERSTLPELPERPADSASKDDWVAYCVALGASDHVGGDSRHWDPDAVGEQGEAGAYVVAPALTKAELIDLADRLGG